MTVIGSFVGRGTEHRDVEELLGNHRVVTLVGPGGVGKTRLATELARVGGHRFGGRVLFTELSGVDDRDDIAGVVAAQHGFSSIDALRLSSSSAPTLLVLDNCESALHAAADVATALVAGGSEITILATSRAPLQIYGERIFVVSPLELPVEDLPAAVQEAAATRLFLERAEMAGATWELTDDNLLAIGRIVRRLDGLPLAIELAAARSRVLAPPELVLHLDHQLDLLERSGGGATAHHSGLRGAIRSSYEPLRPELQRVFRALSVFSAPFDLDLAHGVVADGHSEIDTLDRLTELVDLSLVDARADDDGVTRYRLLDSIRAFGREQLDEEGERDDITERHVDAVLDFADRITLAGLESFSPDVLNQIRRQFFHLVHAIEWCVAHDPGPDRAYRMFVPMYGPTGSRREVASLGRSMRDRWDTTAPLEAEAWAVLATAIFLSGDSEGSAEVAREAIEHPDGSPLAKMIGHRVLGFVAAQAPDGDEARAHLQAAVDLAVPFSAAFARELQASWAAVTSGEPDSVRAIEVLEEIHDAAIANDEMVTALWADMAAAAHRVRLDDIDGAVRSAAAALSIADATGFPWSPGAAHRMMGNVMVIARGWAAAAPHFRTAFDHTLAAGDLEGLVVTLRSAAGGAEWLGDRDLVDRLWAVMPAGRGRPVITSFFLDCEAVIEERLGTPTAGVTPDLVEQARVVLGPPAGVGADGVARGTGFEDGGVGDGGVEDGGLAAGGSVGEAPARPRVRFDDCEVDLGMRELWRAGERVHVEPQVFDLLVFLLERRGTVVAKEDILDGVWGDRFVSESALTSRIKSLRQATGDDGRAQRVIRTAHGKGYAFVADVDDA